MAMIDLKPSLPTVRLGINNYAVRPMLPRPSLKISQGQSPVLKSRHAKDLGDILLGGPLGTRQLRETLNDFGWHDAIHIPILNKVLGAGALVWERTLEPLTKGHAGVALINSLETVGSSLDILANPVKSLLPWAGGGEASDFYKSLGWVEGEYRETYQSNTGNFILDMLTEILSDPINWITLGANTGMKQTIDPVLDATKKSLSHRLNLTEVSDAFAKEILAASAEDMTEAGLSKIVATMNRNRDVYIKALARHNVDDNASFMLDVFKRNYDKILENPGLMSSIITDIRQAKNYSAYISFYKLARNAKRVDNAVYFMSNAIAPMRWLGSVTLNKTLAPVAKHLYLNMVKNLKEVVSRNDILKIDPAQVVVTKKHTRDMVITALNSTLRHNKIDYDVDYDALINKFLAYLNTHRDENIETALDKALSDFITWLEKHNTQVKSSVRRHIKGQGIDVPTEVKKNILELSAQFQQNSTIINHMIKDPQLQRIVTTVATAGALEESITILVSQQMIARINDDFNLLYKTNDLPINKYLQAKLTGARDAIQNELRKVNVQKKQVRVRITQLNKEITEAQQLIEDASNILKEFPKQSIKGKAAQKTIQQQRRRFNFATKEVKVYEQQLIETTAHMDTLKKNLKLANANIKKTSVPHAVNKLWVIQEALQERYGLNNFGQLPTLLSHLNEIKDFESLNQLNTILGYFGINQDNCMTIDVLLRNILDTEDPKNVKTYTSKLMELLRSTRLGIRNTDERIDKLNMGEYSRRRHNTINKTEQNLVTDVIYNKRQTKTKTKPVNVNIKLDKALALSNELDTFLTELNGRVPVKKRVRYVLEDKNGKPKVHTAYVDTGEYTDEIGFKYDALEHLDDVVTGPSLPYAGEDYTIVTAVKNFMESVSEYFETPDPSGSGYRTVLFNYDNIVKRVSYFNAIAMQGTITDPEALATINRLVNIVGADLTTPTNLALQSASAAILYHQKTLKLQMSGVNRFNLTNEYVESYLGNYLDQLINPSSDARAQLNKIIGDTANKSEFATLRIGLYKLLAIVDCNTNINHFLYDVTDSISLYDINGNAVKVPDSIRNYIYNTLYDKIASASTMQVMDADKYIATKIMPDIFGTLAKNEEHLNVIGMLLQKEKLTDIDTVLFRRDLTDLIKTHLAQFTDELIRIQTFTKLPSFVTPGLSYINIEEGTNIIRLINDLGASDNLLTQILRNGNYTPQQQHTIHNFMAHITNENYIKTYRNMCDELYKKYGYRDFDDDKKLQDLFLKQWGEQLELQNRDTLASALVGAFRSVDKYNMELQDRNSLYKRVDDHNRVQSVANYIIASDIDIGMINEALALNLKLCEDSRANLTLLSRLTGVGFKTIDDPDETFKKLLKPYWFKFGEDNYMDNALYQRIKSKMLTMRRRIVNNIIRPGKDYLNDEYNTYMKARLFDFMNTLGEEPTLYTDFTELDERNKLKQVLRNASAYIYDNKAGEWTNLDLEVWNRTLLSGVFGADIAKAWRRYLKSDNVPPTIKDHELWIETTGLDPWPQRPVKEPKAPDIIDMEQVDNQIDKFEMYNMASALDTIDDPDSTLDDVQRAIEQCLPSTYIGLYDEWWIQQQQTHLHDFTALSEYNTELNIMQKRNGTMFGKFRNNIQQLADNETKVYNYIQGDSYKEYVRKNYGITPDTKMNEHKVGRMLNDEIMIDRATNVLNMNPTQLRAYVDQMDGLMIFANSNMLDFTKYKYLKELNSVGLIHNTLKTKYGTFSFIRRTDANRHKLDYTWHVAHSSFKQTRKHIATTLREAGYSYNLDGIQVPWELFTGESLDEGWLTSIFESEAMFKYVGTVEEQTMYRTIDKKARLTFLNGINGKRPDLMIHGENNAKRRLQQALADLDPSLSVPYLTDGSIYRNMISNSISAISKADSLHKVTEIFFNDDFCMSAPWLKEKLLELNDAQIKDLFGRTGNKVVVLRYDKHGDPRVYDLLVTDRKSLRNAINMKASILTYEMYRTAHFVFEHKIEPSGVIKAYKSFIAPLFKMIYLSGPGFLMRNALDTIFYKNAATSGGVSDLITNFTYNLNAGKLLDFHNNIDERILTYSEENYGKRVYRAEAVRQVLKTLTPAERYKFILTNAFVNSGGSAGLSDTMTKFLKDIHMALDDEYDEEAWQNIINNMVFGNPYNVFHNKINNWIESTSRLGLFLKLVDEGTDTNHAIRKVIETHFDYKYPMIGGDLIKEIFWFSTFPINNVMYYLNYGITENPDMIKTLYDAIELSWNDGKEMTWDRVRKTPYLTYNALAGNIRFNMFGKNIVLKTGSSAFDFFNIIGNPLDEVFDRLNPFLGILFGAEELSALDPTKTIRNRAGQILAGRSLVPSVYTTITEYPKQGRINRASRTRTWRTYPKKYYPKKPKRIRRIRNRNALRAWSYKNKLRLRLHEVTYAVEPILQYGAYSRSGARARRDIQTLRQKTYIKSRH